MQPVRDRYPALFHPDKGTMQLFMWQVDIVGVAHYIMECFDFKEAVSGARDDASDSSSSALAAEYSHSRGSPPMSSHHRPTSCVRRALPTTSIRGLAAARARSSAVL